MITYASTRIRGATVHTRHGWMARGIRVQRCLHRQPRSSAMFRPISPSTSYAPIARRIVFSPPPDIPQPARVERTWLTAPAATLPPQKSLVRLALETNDIHLLRKCIAEGDDINGSNTDGTLPLVIACSDGWTEAIRLLLENGADANRPDANGTLPFVAACSQGSTETIQLLLENGAEINVRNNSRQTPLMLSVAMGRLEVVQELVRNGADVNAADCYGATALMIAASRGNEATSNLLLCTQAKVDMVDYTGATALMHAVRGGHEHIALRLLWAHADVNVVDSRGATALMYAARRDHDWLVRQLILHGARLDVVNPKGEAALSIAERCGHPGLGATLRTLLGSQQPGRACTPLPAIHPPNPSEDSSHAIRSATEASLYTSPSLYALNTPSGKLPAIFRAALHSPSSSNGDLSHVAAPFLLPDTMASERAEALPDRPGEVDQA